MNLQLIPFFVLHPLTIKTELATRIYWELAVEDELSRFWSWTDLFQDFLEFF